MLITWEYKLHDKITSVYSKSCEYKKFSVHTNTKKYRFQIVPLWRAFSKSSVFVDLFMRISVDGSRIRNNKVAFSNLSGIVWTGPQSKAFLQSTYLQIYCVSLFVALALFYNPNFVTSVFTPVFTVSSLRFPIFLFLMIRHERRGKYFYSNFVRCFKRTPSW